MKRVFSVLLLLCLCVGISGCGSSNNTKDIQEKIEKAGFSVNLDKDVGTLVAEINLTKKNDATELDININKETSKATEVVYSNELEKDGSNVKQDVTYAFKDKVNMGYSEVDDSQVCVGYDVEKNNFIQKEFETLSFDCQKSDKDNLKELMKTRDKDLKSMDITLEDLEEFGNWYYSNNK